MKHNRSLKVLSNYILENPCRLWIRQYHPEFFSKTDRFPLLDNECNLYGNQSLLNHPFIYPVVVHRSFSPEELGAKKEEWQYAISNGGVLAGAFISQKEKEILKEALENDGKIILLSNHKFEEREKPTGKLFEACCRGKLLIVSPEMNGLNVRKGDKSSINREECFFLNSFAEKIAYRQH